MITQDDIEGLAHDPDADMEFLLDTLRENNWFVAVHNDYVLDNERMTFWLLTHSSGVFVKGEGSTDREALLACVRSAYEIFEPGLGKLPAIEETPI